MVRAGTRISVTQARRGNGHLCTSDRGVRRSPCCSLLLHPLCQSLRGRHSRPRNRRSFGRKILDRNTFRRVDGHVDFFPTRVPYLSTSGVARGHCPLALTVDCQPLGKMSCFTYSLQCLRPGAGDDEMVRPWLKPLDHSSVFKWGSADQWNMQETSRSRRQRQRWECLIFTAKRLHATAQGRAAHPGEAWHPKRPLPRRG